VQGTPKRSNESRIAGRTERGHVRGDFSSPKKKWGKVQEGKKWNHKGGIRKQVGRAAAGRKKPPGETIFFPKQLRFWGGASTHRRGPLKPPYGREKEMGKKKFFFRRGAGKKKAEMRKRSVLGGPKSQKNRHGGETKASTRS